MQEGAWQVPPELVGSHAVLALCFPLTFQLHEYSLVPSLPLTRMCSQQGRHSQGQQVFFLSLPDLAVASGVECL